MSIHDGHRARLKERFLEQGLDGFTDVQVLELLLYFSIPRRDTNELAHKLIGRFGSLSQVLNTGYQELMDVDGVGENTALFLTLLPSAYCFYSMDKEKQTDAPLLTTTDCGNYLMNHFNGRCNETVFLLCLDGKCKPLCCLKIGEGGINSAGVPVRRVVEAALGAKATSVVLAHNHPSGIALPSSEDIHTTHRIATALAAVDVKLADHIVVADSDFVSLAQSGYFRPEDSAF